MWRPPVAFVVESFVVMGAVESVVAVALCSARGEEGGLWT